MQLRARTDWRILAGAAVTAVVFGLTGCGGDGGGGGGEETPSNGGGTSDIYTGSTEPVTITDSNGEAVAAAVMGGTSSATGASDSGTDASGQASSAGVSKQEEATGVVDYAMQANRLASEGGGSQRFAGATQEVQDCPDGGTITTTYNDTGGNAQALDSPEDEKSIEFADCQFDSTTLTMTWDGEMTLVLIEGNFAETDQFELEMVFNNWSVSESGAKVFEINGPVQTATGLAHAGDWPQGHSPVNASLSDSEERFGMGIGEPFEVVNHEKGESFLFTEANLYLRDSNKDGDFTGDNNAPWWMAMHGTGSTNNNNTMKMCNDQIDGCTWVDHEATTAFTFEDDGNPHPISGALQVNGDDGYIKMDADTGNPETLYLTINGDTEEVLWDELSVSSFSDNL